MSQQVKVGILGQEYTIRAHADRAHVERVAQYVASKCQEAKNSLRSSSLVNITVLAALNIASDHLKLKEAYDQLLARIETKQQKLTSLVS